MDGEERGRTEDVAKLCSPDISHEYVCFIDNREALDASILKHLLYPALQRTASAHHDKLTYLSDAQSTQSQSTHATLPSSPLTLKTISVISAAARVRAKHDAPGTL